MSCQPNNGTSFWRVASSLEPCPKFDLREHHPELQFDRFPEGPQRIRFDSADLCVDGFGSQCCPNGCNEMCARDRYTTFRNHAMAVEGKEVK